MAPCPRPLAFGPFRLDLAEERLWKGTELLTLRRKAFALLRYLAENPRRLITQEELIRSVWDGAAISESLVRGCVRELRQVIGDDVLETVIGRGYRFVMPIAVVAETPASELAPPAPARAPTAHKAPALAPLLIGREDELAQLEMSFTKVLAGERRLVFVAGEPGIGKTALVDAFVESVVTRAIVARGHCVEQFGSREAYLPVLSALASICRGPSGERATALLSRYAPTWLLQIPGLVSDAEIEAIQRRVGAATQARMLRELGDALEALSVEQPVVLAFEDLHWSDHSTADVIALLGQRRDSARLMVIGTTRPAELLAPSHPLNKISRELAARGYADVVLPGAFDEEGTAQYLSTRFPRHQFPPELARTVHAITGGRPLFVVALSGDLETKRLIVEEGGHFRLRASLEEVARQRPESVTQLIDIQMDRLSGPEQRVLEAGSVVGLAFTVGLVAAVLEQKDEDVEDLCHGLARRRSFLHQVGIEEWPDGTTQTRFALTHSLFQHVASERSTPARKRGWHRRIAARLEVGYGDRAEEVASELAAHLDRAGEYDRAARWYAIAAERASKRYVSMEGIDQLRRALSLIEKVPSSPERDRLELRLLRDLAPMILAQPHVEDVDHVALSARAVEIAERAGTRAELAHALSGLGFAHRVRAQFKEAEELDRRLVALDAFQEDAELQLSATVGRATTAYWQGDLTAARETFEAALCGYEQAGIAGSTYQSGAVALTYLAEIAWLLGHPKEATVAAERAVTLGRASSFPTTFVFTLMTAARISWLLGDAEGVLEPTEAALSVSEEYGERVFEGELLIVRACARAALGQGLVSPDEIHDAEWPQRRIEVGRARTQPLLAALWARANRPDRALACITEGLDLARARGIRVWEPELLRLKGELLRASDEGAAETCFLEAFELSRARGARSLELRAATSLCRLWSGSKKQKKGLERLADAVAFFTEGFETADLADANALLRRR
jgi:DNA-binding winged helix-turn-helix (wHTH) protein/tetratricopeptide (TPR) repeat protein